MPTPSSWSPVTSTSLSGDPVVDSLILGTRWASSTISFSFPDYGSLWSTSITEYGATTSGREPWTSWFEPLSASDRPFFVGVLQQWSAVANINFVQVADSSTSVGDIRAAYTYQSIHDDAAAWAYYPSQSAAAGDMWFNALGTSGTDVWRLGSYANFTVLHELGHAIGLKHPFSGTPTLAPGWETQIFTVMSYTAYPAYPATSSWLTYYPTTPMLLDILAVQQIYGANTSYHSGNDTYTFADVGFYNQTIWDAGGADTIQYNGTLPSWIDLKEGHGSTIGNPVYASTTSSSTRINNLWVAYGTTIENVVGGNAADTLIGTHLSNTLTGRAGNDSITGDEGNDWLIGGAGNDYLDGGSGLDKATFSGLTTQYTVQRNGATVTVRGLDGVDTLTGVERLQFNNAWVALDVDGNAGQAYRLYQAAFNRTPDSAGLGFQMGALDAGWSLVNISQNFIDSPEFQRTYGTLTNTQFVNQLYLNVLHRPGELAGVDYHVSNLNVGWSRAHILTNFSESPENQAALIGVISNGMIYT